MGFRQVCGFWVLFRLPTPRDALRAGVIVRLFSAGSQVAVSQNVHKAAALCLPTSACSGNQSLRERWLECGVPAQSPTDLCPLTCLVFVYFSKPCESVYLLQWASGMSAVSESCFGYPPLVMSWGQGTLLLLLLSHFSRVRLCATP